MGFQWHFQMNFGFCDFRCVTFCPESGGAAGGPAGSRGEDRERRAGRTRTRRRKGARAASRDRDASLGALPLFVVYFTVDIKHRNSLQALGKLLRCFMSTTISRLLRLIIKTISRARAQRGRGSSLLRLWAVGAAEAGTPPRYYIICDYAI